MKNLSFYVIIALAFMLTSCKGTAEKQEFEPLTFSTYEKEEAIESPEGVSAGMTLKIDIPDDESERSAKVVSIIRQLITDSEIGDQVGTPKEGSLQEVCDDYIERFRKGIAQEDLTPGCEYHLEILSGYQSADYICFHVSDGIFGNGGPMEREVVFRLSDEHKMEEGEMYNLPDDKWMELAKKYAEGEEKEKLQNIESLMGGEIVPDEKGCKYHYATSMHIFNVVYFPVSEIASYLTEEGRQIFGVTEEQKTEETSQEEPVAEVPKEEPGRGELGIFDLRGPVKECKWKTENGTKAYTFDENGFWLTEDGQKLKDVFLGGIERDAQKRIKDGWVDGYGSRHYTYNAQGLATIIEEDGSKQTLTYDADGYVKKEILEIYPEMGDDEGTTAEQHTFTYTILEKDEIGNWTKRKSNRGTETRTITYY